MDDWMKSGMMGGMGGILGGLFGNSGAPYDDAMKQYQQWANKAQGAQNPFYNAGVGAVGGMQDWLGKMKDPSQFINSLMGQYQQSPWAKYQNQNAMRAANNMGAATGLTGSTPMQMQAQQNATNIGSQDMNQWLQNVLGINSQYGSGMSHMMDMGANSANSLTNMYGQMGQQMGEAAYGKRAGENSDWTNLLSGGLSLAGMFL